MIGIKDEDITTREILTSALDIARMLVGDVSVSTKIVCKTIEQLAAELGANIVCQEGKIVLQKRKTGISLNKGAQASLWSVSSNILCRGIGFLFTPIFTRALSPTEYGIYPLYTSLMGIFTPLITLEATGGFIYRLIAKCDERKKAKFLSSLLFKGELQLNFG